MRDWENKHVFVLHKSCANCVFGLSAGHMEGFVSFKGKRQFDVDQRVEW